MEFVLLNISNQNSKDWSKEQQEMWDKIIDIPFPKATLEEATKEIIDEIRSFVQAADGNFYHAVVIDGDPSVYQSVMKELTKKDWRELVTIAMPMRNFRKRWTFKSLEELCMTH